MHFLSPWWLLTLIAVLLLALAYLIVQLRRKVFVARFSNVDLLGSIAPRRPGWRRHLTFALLLVAMAVLSLGIARPSSAVRVPRERATVILAIDVSPSMQATDVLPSRIAAAKSAGAKFAGLLPKHINLGLVSFGGSANLLVSPTLNRTVVKDAISKMTLQPSTAIGEAIFTSLQAISVFSQATTAKGDKPPPARIVLLSDGSNTVGRSVASAVAAANKAGVEVSTIAFGTQTGTVTYEGQTYAVPADEHTLSLIAAETHGSYHAAHTAQQLEEVYQNIGSQIGYTVERKDISWRFLSAGFLIMLAAAGSSLLWAGRLV